MKLKPYQLALWADAASHNRRSWFFLAGNVLLLLLALPLGLFWPILTILLLLDAALAIYLLHRHHAFGRTYQRKPRPTDALCETVLIDPLLIGHGMRLRAAAQPVDVSDGLSLRMGSGALLLGTAMVLTADEMSKADRAAILSAVNALNLKPSRLMIHNPVLRRETLREVKVITVRDGLNDRRYYLGTPDAVAAICPFIWENTTRPMEPHDLVRIEDTARYIRQGDCRVFAWATALEGEEPTFLGMGGIGEEVHLSAMQDAATLRSMGLTLMLEDGQNPADAECLRAMLQLQEHHARADIHLTEQVREPQLTGPLRITRHPGESLVEPVSTLRTRFQIIEDTLRCFSLMLGLPLLVCLITGAGPACVGAAALLTAAAIWVGADLTAPKLRWPAMIFVVLIALLTRVFMSTQSTALVQVAGGILTLVTAMCTARRLGGYGFRFSFQLRNPAFWLASSTAAMLLVLLIVGCLQGLAALLPLFFSALMSALISLLILLENKIFR